MKNRNNKLILFMLFVFITLIDSELLSADRQVVLGTPKSKDSQPGLFLNLIYTEAFKRMDMTFVFKTYHAKRSSAMSDSGEIDGELSRIYSYNVKHPNLIRVEEPHWSSGFIAVSGDPSIQLYGWESLKDHNYQVVYQSGIKGCEVNLPRVVEPDKLSKVNTMDQGFKMLLVWKTGIVFVGAEMNIVDLLDTEEFRSSDLKIVGVMDKFTSHVFLHKKNKELVPKLSKVLANMKKEGLFEQYRERVGLKGYFND